MPPFQRSGALEARGSRYPPIALNIPVIGLVIAFAMLLLVCLCMCCCSYRKAAKRIKRHEQRPYRVDGARVGFTQLNSPLGSEESIERQEVPEIKPENQSRFSKPPAYSVVNSPLLPSPQIFQSESMHLLCPSPTTPRPLSPPPPIYNANR
jgi:hypothetical protein